VTLAFRNVDADVADPVSSWPQEALQAALERGDLTHWRRVAAEIRDWPWGRVARGVEEILTYSRPYGVTGLMERAIDAARQRAARSEIDEVASRIRGLRESSGLSVSEFARLVGTSRSRMSTYLAGKVVPSAAMLVRMERAARLSSAATVTTAVPDGNGRRGAERGAGNLDLARDQEGR
jgi:DNA-binding XRE family transcriptional regulator